MYPTGYAPRDGGYLLCPDCHDRLGHDPDTCDCGADFRTTETDSAQACDTCGAEIETRVLYHDD